MLNCSYTISNKPTLTEIMSISDIRNAQIPIKDHVLRMLLASRYVPWKGLHVSSANCITCIKLSMSLESDMNYFVFALSLPLGENMST